ncbi:hypothetical protein SKAU_G00022140 [Synaphobranchus kaupii]|uniref:Lipoprotein n=1 Tax=Synaphobranchus kaupii TaxID=118154 RepID=A0A9Q1GC02_SYNKA|nr:hypothetical protein SKAU_G00022140 [Synaphobranchus kaupii]
MCIRIAPIKALLVLTAAVFSCGAEAGLERETGDRGAGGDTPSMHETVFPSAPGLQSPACRSETETNGYRPCAPLSTATAHAQGRCR